jgi:hypothetical protein
VDIVERRTFLVRSMMGPRFVCRPAPYLVANGMPNQNVFFSVGIHIFLVCSYHQTAYEYALIEM